jgi:cytoskeletal protein RodZ
MIEFFLKYWVVSLLLGVWICFATFINTRARRKEKKPQEKDAQKKAEGSKEGLEK